MAETLLALLLVTTSARESNLVFRWPEFPTPSPRLSRARPDESLSLSQLDNPWRASHPQEVESTTNIPAHDFGHDPDYRWQRSKSLNTAAASAFHAYEGSPIPDEHEHVLGYSDKFLAQHLCPQRSMCHQKFELIVDDLAFIGHPVCADSDGGWRFRPEKIKAGSRGRGTRDVNGSVSPLAEGNTSLSPEMPTSEPSSTAKSNWLHTFHLVLVLDLPDPSSSASGNLSKYFNILYEQIAFTLTAVLYQEQVLSNFVERECEILGSLKESAISRGESFSKYASQALEVSSIAPAMKSIFEAIKSSSVAYITVNYLPLELQLPPYLDALLHNQDDQETDTVEPFDDDVTLNWGQDMSLGWELPTIAPWKTLLLLDIDNDMDPHQILKGPNEATEDRTLVEELIRFLETASVTLSLSEMANLLDWDLESRVYPIVKWLVLHRRAKVVDVVHAGLKTAFALPPKFIAPLPQLSAAFQAKFPHPSIPPLPRILSTISLSMSKQSDNHFFASVVKSKEFIPMYHDVVLWMLKRDMLITLHLRIRIVATRELKLRVKEKREQRMARKRGTHRRQSDLGYEFDEDDLPATSFFMNSGSHPGRKFARRMSSRESGRSEISELNFHEDSMGVPLEDDIALDTNSEADAEDSGWDTTEDHLSPSMITDPGKATAMQRHWLSAMSEGKQPHIARRFEMINRYFDGKRSDDEILFRAEISRKQLREVLHHYEEYLQTFLHPS